jgi:hypothetical protein
VLNKFFKKENCVDDKNNFQAQVLRDVHFRDSGAHSLSCNSREEVKEEIQHLTSHLGACSIFSPAFPASSPLFCNAHQASQSAFS